MIDSVIKVVAFLKSWWRNPFCGVIIPIFTLIICLRVEESNLVGWLVERNEKVTWFINGGITLLTFLVWFLVRRPRTTKRRCIGFPIAIKLPQGADHSNILQRDFLCGIQKQVTRLTTGPEYDCFNLPDYYSKKVSTNEDARKLLLRTKGHCMLWGEIIVRNVNGQPHYVADLQWIVSHLPIPQPASNKFAMDVGQVWFKKHMIPLANDLLGLEFSSRYVSLVILYIVGTAALMSQQPSLAEQLYERLRGDIDNFSSALKGQPPFLKLLREKAMRGLIHTFTVLHLHYNKAWRSSRALADIDKMKDYSEKVRAIDRNNYSANLDMAIWHFVVNKDIVAAKAALSGNLNNPDSTWLYSLAFLQAYEDHLSDAYKTYKKAFKGECNPDVPMQCEEFIHWVLEKEPDKVQLLFCLGLINFYDKKDYAVAKDHYERFLATAPPSRYQQPKSVAKHCLVEIDRKLLSQ